MEQNKNLLYFGGILAVGFLLSAAIVARTMYKVKTLDSSLAVTGSARQQITSDAAHWVSAFSRTISYGDLAVGYAQMRKDQAAVLKFLSNNGITSEQITVSTVMVEDQSKYNPQAPKEYTLRQNVEVRSSEVGKITELAKNFQPLVDQGIIFSTQVLEYTYTKLADLRVTLLSDAVKDAQTRAEKIAESTGRRVGDLRSASMGVVQVLPMNSTEVSDYGAYDTSSIIKEVMVTVKTQFSLK